MGAWYAGGTWLRTDQRHFPPTLLPYTVIGMLFGVLANFMAKKGLFSAFWKAPLNGIVIGIISTCIAVPITATLYGGFVGTGASVIVTTLMAAGWNVVPATFVSELSSELLDKIICLIIIFFVLKAMPARFVVNFQTETASSKRTNREDKETRGHADTAAWLPIV